MTVWIVNPFDNLPLEGFRPQRYWLMSKAFADAGHDVTFFTSDFNHTTKKKRVLNEAFDPRGRAAPRRADTGRDGVAPPLSFKVEFIPTKPYSSNVSLSRIRSHRAFVAALRAEFNSRLEHCTRAALGARQGNGGAPDVVIVSLPLIGTAAVALELKKKFGTKVVVDIMDDWPGTFYRLFPRILRPFAKLALSPLCRAANRAYREADLVTGVADRYSDLALRAGAKRYCRFYHGISLCGSGKDSASPAEDASQPGKRNPGRSADSESYSQLGMRNPFRSADSVRSILYLGNLGRTYDLTTAIEAVALDPNLTLDIAGKGDQEETLKAIAAVNGVADRVRFHGYLDEKAIAELASHCQYGLIPMSDDSCVGIPYKLADYVRYGLFILSSLRGESAALLTKYSCGALYDSGDPRSLLEKLEVGKSSVSPATCPLTPDFQALLSELDADLIYRSYVSEISKI